MNQKTSKKPLPWQPSNPKFLVTGGHGFIGSTFIRLILDNYENAKVLNIDRRSAVSAGNPLRQFWETPFYRFEQGDLTSAAFTQDMIQLFQPNYVVNFAAESHVDKSIDSPLKSITNNTEIVLNLLEACLSFWSAHRASAKTSTESLSEFKFLQVSTDEVYGSLDLEDAPFTESSQYAPTSPYSSSKAAGDHFVKSYSKTYGFPAVITCCSNNYGPFQLPEKLIPLMILNAVNRKRLPIYGNGKQIRDWLHVEDHCLALLDCLKSGKNGETYNLGGGCEINNISTVNFICDVLDEVAPMHSTPRSPKSLSYRDLIEFVEDRPGHDYRYAIDYSKATTQLGWAPKINFETGLKNTISWYLNNSSWTSHMERLAFDRQGLGPKT